MESDRRYPEKWNNMCRARGEKTDILNYACEVARGCASLFTSINQIFEIFLFEKQNLFTGGRFQEMIKYHMFE